MRKIIASLAISADGYIARPDGNVDWLNNRPRPRDGYDMAAFMRSVDTVLWGMNTYRLALTMGGVDPFGSKLKNYVFSRQPQQPAEDVEFVSEPIPAFTERLRAMGGKDIWMMGGGSIIASFLDAGEMDEFRIHVIPIFIGEGIRLIEARHRDVKLKLQSSRKFSDGVVDLHYRVLKRA